MYLYQYSPVSVCQFVHVSVYQCNPVSVCQFVHVPVYQLVHVSVYQYSPVSVCQFVHALVYQLVHVSVYQLFHVSVYQFVHVSVYQFVHVSVYQFVPLYTTQIYTIKCIKLITMPIINGTFSDPRTEIYWSAYHLKIPLIIASTLVTTQWKVLGHNKTLSDFMSDKPPTAAYRYACAGMLVLRKFSIIQLNTYPCKLPYNFTDSTKMFYALFNIVPNQVNENARWIS